MENMQKLQGPCSADVRYSQWYSRMDLVLPQMGPILFWCLFKPQQHISLQNGLVLVEKSSICRWEASLLFYGNCACVNSHYYGNCLIFKFVMKWLFMHITPTIFLFFFKLFSHLFVSLSVRLFLLKATLRKNIPLGRGVNTSCLCLISVTPAWQ